MAADYFARNLNAALHQELNYNHLCKDDLPIPTVVAPGMSRRDAVHAVCSWLTPKPADVLRCASGTSVVAAGGYVVRAAEPGRSAISIAHNTEIAGKLRSAGIPTPVVVGRLVVGRWELTVWERHRDVKGHDWALAGTLLARLHKLDPAELAPFPPFTDTLTRGKDRVERYAAEVPGLLRRWEDSVEHLYRSGGEGVIHGDMNVGNILWGDPVMLCNFEAFCTGPAEWDLARLCNSADARFGRGTHRLVLAGYGGQIDACAFTACAAIDHLKHITWQLSEIDSGIDLGIQREELLTLLAAA